MEFVEFVTDQQRIRKHSAKPVATLIFPVKQDGYYFGDSDAQIELIEPRLFGWMRWLFPDRKTWVTPIVSDDAYPLRFEYPHYRATRDDDELGANEVAAHELTYDVAMTEIQRRSGSSVWNLPLIVMMICVSFAFLAMIVAWIVTGGPE